MKFRLSGWLLREGWHVDSKADDDALEMTGIMIIWKSISARAQTEAHLGKNKQKPAEFLFSGHTWDWQVAAW